VDQIKVKIPASPVYLRVVRLTAAGLASRLGFTIDEIEDLKIAVDELAAYLTGAQGRDGDIEITFSVHDDRIDIQGVGRLAPGQKARTQLTEISKMILSTVVDSATLTRPDGHPMFELTKARKA
jgi:serine/threonine-protein kinase RsbW